MTKTDECIAALEKIGRAATAAEIALVARQPKENVSSLLRNHAAKHRKIAYRFFESKDGPGKKAYYYVIRWPDHKKNHRDVLFRPLNDDREPLWHLRKIAHYGINKWCQMVLRDPFDLLLKLKGHNYEHKHA